VRIAAFARTHPNRLMRALLGVSLAFSLSSCLDLLGHAALDTEVDDVALHLVTLSTYDSLGQVVHPDAITVPAGWGLFSRYLAITTYAFGDQRREFPSVFASSDGATWQLPSGEPNPVVRPVGGAVTDPDLLYEPDSRELWMYYRLVVSDSNVIALIRSGDGVHWSAPIRVAAAPGHRIISPSVVRRGLGDWWMWSVDGGGLGCRAPSTTVELRKSPDGVHWGTPTTVQLLHQGVTPWHIDVEWIPTRGEFWALYPVKRPGSCRTPAVYIATSADGIHWTPHATPVLAQGALPEFRDIVYRSSFEYDAARDAITFWYSGARFDGHHFIWRAALEQRRRSAVFGRSLRPYFLTLPIPDSSYFPEPDIEP
jgi:hypothetical protein